MCARAPAQEGGAVRDGLCAGGIAGACVRAGRRRDSGVCVRACVRGVRACAGRKGARSGMDAREGELPVDAREEGGACVVCVALLSVQIGGVCMRAGRGRGQGWTRIHAGEKRG